jgi:glutamine synthetase
MRSPDASANVYLLMASLAVACRYGFSLKDGVAVADSTYVNVNIHKKENAKILKTLSVLPDSCASSADCLEKQRAIYEEKGVFSKAMIDGIIAQLRAFKDRSLRAKVSKSQKAMMELVEEFFHCG